MRGIAKRPYRALHSLGNDLSIKEWISIKSDKQSTRLIVDIRNNKIDKYDDVCNIDPVFAFKCKEKIRRFILLNKQKITREQVRVGFRRLNENWEHVTQIEREIFYRISY